MGKGSGNLKDMSILGIQEKEAEKGRSQGGRLIGIERIGWWKATTQHRPSSVSGTTGQLGNKTKSIIIWVSNNKLFELLRSPQVYLLLVNGLHLNFSGFETRCFFLKKNAFTTFKRAYLNFSTRTFSELDILWTDYTTPPHFKCNFSRAPLCFGLLVSFYFP